MFKLHAWRALFMAATTLAMIKQGSSTQSKDRSSDSASSSRCRFGSGTYLETLDFMNLSAQRCLMYTGPKTVRRQINLTHVPSEFFGPAVSFDDVKKLFITKNQYAKWINCCKEALECCRKTDMTQNHKERNLSGQSLHKNCPGTWDGASCWPETAPNTTATQPCPTLFREQTSCGSVEKQCTSEGSWLKNGSVGIENYKGCYKCERDIEVYRRSLLFISSVSVLVVIISCRLIVGRFLTHAVPLITINVAVIILTIAMSDPDFQPEPVAVQIIRDRSLPSVMPLSISCPTRTRHKYSKVNYDDLVDLRDRKVGDRSRLTEFSACCSFPRQLIMVLESGLGLPMDSDSAEYLFVSIRSPSAAQSLTCEEVEDIFKLEYKEQSLIRHLLVWISSCFVIWPFIAPQAWVAGRIIFLIIMLNHRIESSSMRQTTMHYLTLGIKVFFFSAYIVARLSTDSSLLKIYFASNVLDERDREFLRRTQYDSWSQPSRHAWVEMIIDWPGHAFSLSFAALQMITYILSNRLPYLKMDEILRMPSAFLISLGAVEGVKLFLPKICNSIGREIDMHFTNLVEGGVLIFKTIRHIRNSSRISTNRSTKTLRYRTTAGVCYWWTNSAIPNAIKIVTGRKTWVSCPGNLPGMVDKKSNNIKELRRRA